MGALYTNKTATSSGGAPVDAEYWTASANSTLTAEKSLAGFTGLVKNTAGTPSQATVNTDYLAPDFDVISRQTLGADAQDVTFAVSDSDEEIEISGFGGGGAGNVTIQVNGGGTAVTYSSILNSNGGAPSGSSAQLFGAYDGPFTLQVIFSLKNNGLKRVGWSNATVQNTGSASRDQWRASFAWPDTSNNVTSVVLHSSVATGWKSGAVFLCKRRKKTA